MRYLAWRTAGLAVIGWFCLSSAAAIAADQRLRVLAPEVGSDNSDAAIVGQSSGPFTPLTCWSCPGCGARMEPDGVLHCEGCHLPARISDGGDALMSEAITTVVRTGAASVALLQRRLRGGYARAGRLIDMMEERGIVSGFDGSKARKVLIDEDDLVRVLGGGGSSRRHALD